MMPSDIKTVKVVFGFEKGEERRGEKKREMER